MKNTLQVVMSFYVFIGLILIYEFLIIDYIRKLLKIIKTRVVEIVFKFFLNLNPKVTSSKKIQVVFTLN